MRKQLHTTLFLLCLGLCQLQAQELTMEPVAELPEQLTDLETSSTGEAESSSHAVPFTLAGGLIIVEAHTGGTTQKYILDTGAPTLVLNQKIPKFHQNANYAVGLAGLSSSMDVEVDYFRMGSIVDEEIAAFATDISHLERIKKMRIDGLIGYKLLRTSNILLDYKSKNVKILPSGEHHSANENQKVLAIPFKKRGHIPMIEVQVGNKKLRMGLDTGSEANLLDLRFKRKLRKNFVSEFNHKYVRGIDKSTLKVSSVTVANSSIQGTELTDMVFLFTDMSFLNQGFGRRMDGILGFPFLKEHMVSIDFGKEVIYVFKDTFEQELEQIVENEELVVDED